MLGRIFGGKKFDKTTSLGGLLSCGHDNVNMPLLDEFRRTSRDSVELELDSPESRDVRRNSPKIGKKKFEKTISLGGLLVSYDHTII